MNAAVRLPPTPRAARLRDPAAENEAGLQRQSARRRPLRGRSSPSSIWALGERRLLLAGLGHVRGGDRDRRPAAAKRLSSPSNRISEADVQREMARSGGAHADRLAPAHSPAPLLVAQARHAFMSTRSPRNGTPSSRSRRPAARPWPASRRRGPPATRAGRARRAEEDGAGEARRPGRDVAVGRDQARRDRPHPLQHFGFAVTRRLGHAGASIRPRRPGRRAEGVDDAVLELAQLLRAR